ncbi:MAG: hypothetical protein QNJ72_12760 [Pleurocapsa sp. MO_226.B13]|nr:hypothetical protein [Pleurocapsa sp. MO_226.B13]
MNYKLDLLKIVPLVTVTTAVLAPVEMATAGPGNDHSHDAEITEHSVILDAEAEDHSAAGGYETAGDHGADAKHSVVKAGATAAGDHGAAAGDYGAAAGDYGAAAGDHGKHKGGIPQILLSPKAQKIEFFAFLSAIGLSVLAPELFHRTKKDTQNVIHLKNNQTQKSSDYRSENHQHQAKADVPHARLVKFSQETEDVQEETTHVKQDTPSFKVVSDSTEPYTIPTKKLGKFDTDVKIKIENWSQPDRDAA